MEKYRRRGKKHLIPRKLSLVSVIFIMVSQFIFMRIYRKEIDQLFVFFDLNIYQPYQGVLHILLYVGIVGVLIFAFGTLIWLVWSLKKLEKREKKVSKENNAELAE